MCCRDQWGFKIGVEYLWTPGNQTQTNCLICGLSYTTQLYPPHLDPPWLPGVCPLALKKNKNQHCSAAVLHAYVCTHIITMLTGNSIRDCMAIIHWWCVYLCWTNVRVLVMHMVNLRWILCLHIYLMVELLFPVVHYFITFPVCMIIHLHFRTHTYNTIPFCSVVVSLFRCCIILLLNMCIYYLVHFL